MILLDLFRQGGWIMWPLVTCSLLSLAIIIERFINLRPARFLHPVISTRIETLIEARAFSRALELCREQPGVFPNLIRTALEAYPSGREGVKDAIEAAGRREIPRVGRYLGTLSTIAGVAPLLGLLGTVLGMIQVFSVVARQGLGQASSLSGGIAVALVSTAFGLIVAIPSLVMYNAFSQRAETIVLDIESRVIALANALFYADGTPVEESEEPSETRSPQRAAPAEV